MRIFQPSSLSFWVMVLVGCSWVADTLGATRDDIARPQDPKDPVAAIPWIEEKIGARLNLRVDPAWRDEVKTARDAASSGHLRMTEEQRRLSKLLEKRSAIAREIVTMVGDDDEAAGVKRNGETLQSLIAALPANTLTLNIHILRSSTFKDLRERGILWPDVVIDDAAQKAILRVEVSGKKPRQTITIPLMVDDPARISQIVGDTIDGFFGIGMAGAALHEVAELAVLHRLRPTGPYYRSDGVANVMAARLLDRFSAAGEGDAYLRQFNTAPFLAEKKQVRLRYWLGAAHAIDTGLETEEKLTHARYAFATEEAKRLVEEQGIGFIRQVLVQMKGAAVADGATLIRVVNTLDGGHFEPRLAAYEDIVDVRRATIEHLNNFEKSADAGDFELALTHIVRAAELGQTTEYRAEYYVMAGNLLLKIGRPDLVHSLFSSQVRSAPKSATLKLKIQWIELAWAAKDPSPVYAVADDVLAIVPTNVPALATKLVEDIREKQDMDVAVKRARHILSLDPEGRSAYSQFAGGFLKKIKELAPNE